MSGAGNRPGGEAQQHERPDCVCSAAVARTTDSLPYAADVQATAAPSGTPLTARVQLHGVWPVVHSSTSVAGVGRAATSRTVLAEERLSRPLRDGGPAEGSAGEKSGLAATTTAISAAPT